VVDAQAVGEALGDPPQDLGVRLVEDPGTSTRTAASVLTAKKRR